MWKEIAMFANFAVKKKKKKRQKKNSQRLSSVSGDHSCVMWFKVSRLIMYSNPVLWPLPITAKLQQA